MQRREGRDEKMRKEERIRQVAKIDTSVGVFFISVRETGSFFFLN